MERRNQSVLAPTIGLAERNANQKKLVILIVFGFFTVPLWGQVSDIGWNNSGAQGIAPADSFIYVNEITAEELIRHPLLTFDEGMMMIQHRAQHGEILELMELQQCRFSPNRLMELRPFLIFSPSAKLARAEWIRELKSPKGNHSYSNTYYPYRLKTTPNTLGGPWGHSLQLRWNNGQVVSAGGSMQLDPGEVMRGFNFPFQQWHVRIGDIPLGRRFGMDKLVLGRYNLQLGQGLVQGGLSGFWSAPLLWARKSPDWDLAEKRGFDEYRGHTGVAMCFHFGIGGANRLGFGNGKVRAGHLRMMIAWSDDKISSRTDTLGRIQSLISDGMFNTVSAMQWFHNTKQLQGTIALQYQSLKRCTYGISWSGYRYSRPWNAMGEWMDFVPALRAGTKFYYPQFWFTHFQKSGGMWFLNTALQCQPVNVDLVFLRSREQSIFYPIAIVMGYVKPMGKNADFSLRYYLIQRNFRPPQGLFNEFQQNHQRLSMTLSSNPNFKYTMKYGTEIGKNLRYNGSGEKPVTVIYQLGISAKHSKLWSTELLWQLRRSDDISAVEYDAATHYSASPGYDFIQSRGLDSSGQMINSGGGNPGGNSNTGNHSNNGNNYNLGNSGQGLDYRIEYGGINPAQSQSFHAFRGRATAVVQYRPAEGGAVLAKISLLPTHSQTLPQHQIWPNNLAATTSSSNNATSNQVSPGNTSSPNQSSSTLANTGNFIPLPNANQSTQIDPHRYKNSMLAAISFTHRKPFTPLKITFESLFYQSNTPLYHQPSTTSTEIANYVLSGQGYGINCLVEYTFKIKLPPTQKSNSTAPASYQPKHKVHHHKIQSAFRAEFLHKNNSQFPNQPRIFVSLCWK